MYSLPWPLISLLSLFTYVQCVTLFVYPGNLADGTDQLDPANNQRYDIGQSIPVKWRTDLTSLSLGVSQILPNGSEIQYMLDYNTTDRSSYWVADFTARNGFQKTNMDSPDWDIDAVFWFQLYNDTDVKGEDPIAITQMFNVSTSDSSSNRGSDTFVYIDRGLSTGATAGIAVGSVAGALLLAGLGFFLWRRSQRAKDAAAVNQQASESQLQPQPIPQQQGVYEYNHQRSASPASIVIKPELPNESANIHEAP